MQPDQQGFSWEQFVPVFREFVPQLVAAPVILVVRWVAAFIARIAADAIRAAGIARANLVAMTARVSIIILAVAMGLGQMGLAEEIIALAFGILFGSFALAAAIAFGMGCRETAGPLFENWVGSISSSPRQ